LDCVLALAAGRREVTSTVEARNEPVTDKTRSGRGIVEYEITHCNALCLRLVRGKGYSTG
jgi:hypothetical protein